MITCVDECSASYRAGQVIGKIIVIVLIVYFIVWLVRPLRTKPGAAKGPGGSGSARTPEMDLAVLATVLTVQAAHDVATALVARVLAQHPALTPVSSGAPDGVAAWSLSGGHPYMTLVPTPAGSVLRVQELEVPLRSPRPAVVWEWALDEVQQEAGWAKIHTYRSQQALAPARALGPYTAIWAPVG